jgi:hypothetical protein
MRVQAWFLAMGAMLMATTALEAQIIKATMSVTGAEMK